MFYSTQVLARKGPLGVVWLAAHMDSKLKKNNVFEANLVGSVGKYSSRCFEIEIKLVGLDHTQSTLSKIILPFANIHQRMLPG